MALLLRLLLSNSGYRRNSDITKAFSVFSYSTEAFPTTAASKTPASTRKDNLFSRIYPLKDLGVPISPVLDQWLEERRGIKRTEVYSAIKYLRYYQCFNQALQVSEWMSKHLELSPGDIGVRLKLIGTAHGIKEAEQYFDSLPTELRSLKVYGALLECYVHAKSMEKAELTMQEMRELGYFKSLLSYNVMLKFYFEARDYQKLEALAEEMEGNGIVADRYTLSYQLKAYAAKSDIEGVEKIVAKIRADPSISADWNIYVAACSGYLEAGLKDKALEMLKTSESLVDVKSRPLAYEILMIFYARLGKKDEVYRLWNLCKITGKVYNKTYFAVLSSLYKLDDIEGMEKIYEEWEAKMTEVDVRAPNLLVEAYCKKGLMEKAESIEKIHEEWEAKMTKVDIRVPNLLVEAYCKKGLMEKAESIEKWLESGNKANPTMWGHMATGYYKCSQFDKAVEAMNKATLVNDPKWKPSISTLAGCTEYLKGKEDEEFAKFRILLDKHSQGSADISDGQTGNL